MKRVFHIKKGEYWDGDEEMIHFLEDYLVEEERSDPFCPKTTRDCKVTIIIEELRIIKRKGTKK